MQILDELEYVLPEEIYKSVHQTISDTLQRQRGNLLSFGFISAAVLSTNGMMAFMSAFNISLRKQDKRSYIKQRSVAMGLTFLLVFIIFLATFLIVTGELIIDQLLNFKLLNTYGWLYYSIDIMRYAVTLISFFFAIVAIYFFGPARRFSFRHQAIGAVVATLFITVASVLFAMYLQYFDTYNKLYGSIGTFIGVMFWFLAISLGILVGFELNVSLARARKITQRTRRRIEGKL
jgi:membrane protein